MKYLLLILTLLFCSCSSDWAAKNYAFPRLKQSVSTIYIVGIVNQEQKLIGTGTAFGISEHKLITAYHVCALKDKAGDKIGLGIDFVDEDTPDERLDATLKIIKTDKENDLCMLKIERKVEYLLLSQWPPYEMDTVYAYGSPVGVPDIMTKGYYLYVKTFLTSEDNKTTFSVYSLPSYFGNSGCPIVDEYGHIVGVVVAGLGMYPQVTFSPPYESLKKFIEEN